MIENLKVRRQNAEGRAGIHGSTTWTVTSEVSSYRGEPKTREIEGHRGTSSFIVNQSCLGSCHFSKESCKIVHNRGKNKESFFRLILLIACVAKQARSHLKDMKTTAMKPTGLRYFKKFLIVDTFRCIDTSKS